MPKNSRRIAEAPLERLRDAMEVLEIVAKDPCRIGGAERPCAPFGAVWCVPCRARQLIEREENGRGRVRHARVPGAS